MKVSRTEPLGTQGVQRWIHFLLLAIPLAMLVACGGGSSGSSTPASTSTAAPDQAAEALIGPAGGTLAASSQGVALKVVVPPNAVPAATRFTLTPVAPADGSAVAFKISPADVVFAEPITVTLTFAPGIDLSSTSLRLGSGAGLFNLATTVDAANNSVTAMISSFASLSATPKSVLMQMAQPIRRLLADAPADDGSTLSAAHRQQIAALVANASQRLADLQTNEDFAAAFALQNSIAALLQRSGQDGYVASAIPFIESARTSACRALANAITRALAATITAQGQYVALVKPILYWEAAAQRMGGEPCPAPTAIDAAHTVLERELAFLQPRLAGASSPEAVSAEMPDIVAAREIKVESRALQSVGPATALDLGPVSQGLQTGLIEPTFAPTRQAAWKSRRETDRTSHYADVLRALGSDPRLLDDIQYGGNKLTVTVRNDLNQAFDARWLGTNPQGQRDPVGAVRAISLGIPSGGSLELDGSINVLTCPTQAQEQVIISFEGVEVARQASQGSRLVSRTLTLPSFTAAQLQAAAQLAGSDKQPRTMVILRQSPCLSVFGIGTEVLFTITIRFNAADPLLKKFEACFFFQPNQLTGAALPVFPNRADFMTLSGPTDQGRQFNIINLGENYRGESNIPRYQTYVLGDSLSFSASKPLSGSTQTFDFTFSVTPDGQRKVQGTVTLTVIDATYILTYDAICDLDLPR